MPVRWIREIFAYLLFSFFTFVRSLLELLLLGKGRLQSLRQWLCQQTLRFSVVQREVMISKVVTGRFEEFAAAAGWRHNHITTIECQT